MCYRLYNDQYWRGVTGCTTASSDVVLQGCTDVVLQGCTDVALQGCTDGVTGLYNVVLQGCTRV